MFVDQFNPLYTPEMSFVLTLHTMQSQVTSPWLRITLNTRPSNQSPIW